MNLRRALSMVLVAAMLLSAWSISGITFVSAADNYTDVAVTNDNLIPSDDNFIKDPAKISHKTGNTVKNGPGDAKWLIDGGVQGVNTTAGEQWITVSPCSGTVYIIADFGRERAVGRILVAGFGPSSGFKHLHLPAFEVYVTNDKDAVLAGNAAATVSAPAATTDGANTHLFTLNEVVNGRYLVMKSSSYNGSDFWLTELAAAAPVEGAETPEVPDASETYTVTQLTADNAAEIPAVNLLSGRIGRTKGMGVLESYSGALTNGIIGGVTQSKGEDGRASLYDGDSEYAYVTYGFPTSVTVEKLLVSGSCDDIVDYRNGGVTYDNQHVTHYRIFMSNAPNELYTDGAEVADYVNPYTESGIGVTQLISLKEAVSCRYIGFMVKKGAYNHARISELGAYAPTGHTPIKVNNGAAIPTDKNLLSDAAYTMLSGSPQSMQEGTDGIIGRINVPSNHTNQMSWGYTPKMYYDLGSSQWIDRLLFANNGSDGGGYLCQGYAFYLGDDAATLFDSEPVVVNTAADNKDYPANLHTLATPVKARYVGITVTGCTKDSGTRIAEVGAYAAKSGREIDGIDKTAVDLLDGLTPTVDGTRRVYALSAVQKPDAVAVTSAALVLCGLSCGNR